MSQQEQSILPVTEKQVFDYLIEHPDFLEKNPSLLSQLSISHQVDGGVSLVERQVKVLREKNRELQGKLIEMLNAAQKNENLLKKSIRLILCLIDCQSLEQLANTLHDIIPREFDLDAVSISLFGHWTRASNVRVYQKSDRLLESLGCNFPDNEPICGRMDSKIRDSLFSTHAIKSGSVAILPLGKNGQLGVLALLSRDQSRFSPDMGDLFLQLISSITTQLLVRFKDFD
ncbi:DUF484 family protein [Pleionea sediminis]|uniref:DUF484 family protein n=1 Tax=Pleionea sediminis TaxID=2569479 RepID=UPI0011862EA6|nr:DUF484 family protein [Pleionea sediminis]